MCVCLMLMYICIHIYIYIHTYINLCVNIYTHTCPRFLWGSRRDHYSWVYIGVWFTIDAITSSVSLTVNTSKPQLAECVCVVQHFSL